MKPIEIPYFLQTDEFLHRSYSIKSYEELPKTGSYFVKDVSLLKIFTAQMISMDSFDSYFNDTDKDYKMHQFALQSELNLKAEYRIFVLDNEPLSVNLYNGASVLSFPDCSSISKMINLIMYHRDALNEDLPRAYTLDVGVTDKNETCILEVHNFISCGTYGFCGNSLINMYKRGIDFEVNRQSKLKG